MNLAQLIQLLSNAWRKTGGVYPTQPPSLPEPGEIFFPRMETPIESQPAPAEPQWHALPGLVIELGDSGYQIRMNLGKATPQMPSRYTLINPEGLTEGWGVDLAAVKRCAENLVRDRAEFVCEAKGWMP